MVLPVNEQLYYFLTSIAGGLFIGILFDIYRIIRGFDTPGKLITIISDLLFWIFTGIVTFMFFLYTNNAYLRYSTFIGLGLGIYIYFGIISKPFLSALRWIVYCSMKFFRILIIFITYPIKLIRYFFRLLFYKSKNMVTQEYSNLKIFFKKISEKQKNKKEKSNK
ncbi:MAG: yabQ [Clostridiales bacterium]|jgi:spore cortex biosynthesis protein YabQ|nr:yabQ [Clostridiales bacterium]